MTTKYTEMIERMTDDPTPIYGLAVPVDYLFEKQTLLNSSMTMLEAEMRFWEAGEGKVNRDTQFARALRQISLHAEAIHVEAEKWRSIIERSQRTDTATRTHTRTRRGEPT